LTFGTEYLAFVARSYILRASGEWVRPRSS